MASSWRHAADALVTDLRHIFAGRLRSLVAYGPRVEGEGDAPLTCLALVESLGISDLEACARMAHHWERRRLASPLVLPDQEFFRSLDAFPLEYGEILRAHESVFGPDPFAGAAISREDLRRACETQVKSHLVHLRQGFIEGGGRPQAIADLVSTSAPAFVALLRNVARLNGSASSHRADATREGARASGLPGGIVTDMLALERQSSMPTTDAARLFPEYLAAVEQLARTVDGWRA
ncbi:MAG: hypothetical protein EXQ53_12975 [Acidobacteria bacterium]|nr:hypothetical protein [Acidobacteriota bacterium]